MGALNGRSYNPPLDDVHEDREGFGFHLVDGVVVAEDGPVAPPRLQKAAQPP